MLEDLALTNKVMRAQRLVREGDVAGLRRFIYDLEASTPKPPA